MRILIADDYSDLRDLVKTLLEVHPGWQVCGDAANGLEAVRKAAQLKPDLVILDLRMPELDGLQAASLISALSPEIPILIYTNHTMGPEAIMGFRKHGVRDVLSKSASPAQLIRAVEKIESQRGANLLERTASGKEIIATAAGSSPLSPSPAKPEDSSRV